LKDGLVLGVLVGLFRNAIRLGTAGG
jgi:hypothetical protein